MSARRYPLVTPFAALFAVINLASPAPLSASSQALKPREREALRYKLESIFNETDLLIQNQTSDKADSRRHDLDARALKVFERIPFEDDLEGLRKQLQESATRFGLKLQDVQFLPRPKPAPVPSELKTDDPRIRLKGEQVAERIPFRARVSGDRAKVREWIASWQTEVLRLIEPKGGYGQFPIQAASASGQWNITAQAFKYRRIEFPKLIPVDPLEVLPKWAKKDPQAFAQAEPKLWSYVARTQELAPQARPLFDAKRDLLLKEARMEFFFQKATPRSKSGHGHP